MERLKKLAPILLAGIAAAAGIIVMLRVYYLQYQEALSFLRRVPVLVYILIGVILLILIVGSAIFYILYKARKEIKPEHAEPIESPDQKAEAEPRETTKKKTRPVKVAKKRSYSLQVLKSSFERALKTLKNYSSVSDYRYEIPWFLMAGEAGSGKTHALERSGLNLSLGRMTGGRAGESAALNWWFFERGVILDLAGDLMLRRGGGVGDERMWKALVKLLQKHRPEKPLDGIILTIPCTDLLPEETGETPDPNKIVEKAELLYKRLWNAQKTLGIRFPTYVLVTRCDQVKGFQAFCEGLPEHFAGHMLGWSSHYSVDAAFSTDWLDEAFQKTIQDLLEVRYEVYTQDRTIQDSDGLFRFASAFRDVFPTLKIYLENIFKQSAYHESFVFRGVYFCGESGIKSGLSGPKIPHYFVKDLIEKKVFPEYALGRPTRRTLAVKNRKVIFAQAVAALLVLGAAWGLWRDYRALNQDTKSLAPVLEEVHLDMLRNRSEGGEEGLMLYSLLTNVDQKVFFEKNALHLVDLMTRVRSLKKTFIPSSWFSPLHDEIRKALTYAYGEIILKAMYIGFVQKAKDVFESADTGRSAADGGELVPVDEIPEFKNLEDFLARAIELSEYIQLYNNLGKSGDMADLGRISKYLFDIDLPQGFYRNAMEYHQALGETEYRVFDPQIFRVKARYSTIKKLIRNLYDRLFQHNPVMEQLQRLSEALTEFGKGGAEMRRNENEVKRLLGLIEQTQTMLADPAVSWMFSDQLNLGDTFSRILALIDQSRFQGPEIREEIQEIGRTEFQAFKEKLRDIRLSSNDFILEVEDDTVTNQLSEKVTDLKTDIGDLLQKDFMTAEPAAEVETAQIDFKDDMRVRWDGPVLGKALRLFEPFEVFQTDQLSKFPEDMQQTIDDMAKENLAAKVESLVARAQRFKSMADEYGETLQEQEVQSEIKNFKEVSGQLYRLLNFSENLELGEIHQRLSDFLYWQTATLFAAVDRLLKEDELYAMKQPDFSWWDGQSKPGWNAYGVNDDEEMGHYLAVQRKRIEHLAFNYAEPLVEFFSRAEILRHDEEKQMVLKWQRILAELDKYKNKKPENNLAMLENFIRFDMNKINVHSFLEVLAEVDLDKRSGDFFLSRRNQIRRSLFNRCQALADSTESNQYADLSGFFNENLAGRFPFSSDPRAQSDADPEDIKAFYKLYDDDQATIRDVLDASEGFGDSKDEVLAFLDRMNTVREFFAPFLPAEAAEGEEKPKVASSPTYDMDIEFRTNQAFEAGANRIIEWLMAVDEQVVRYGGTENVVRWRFGDPILIALRWAKDGLAYPVFAGDGPDVRVDELTVRYRFESPWALLRLLEAYPTHPGDLKDMRDAKPHTLAFKIETMNRGSTLEDEKAKEREQLEEWLAELEFPRAVAYQSTPSKTATPAAEGPGFGASLWREATILMGRTAPGMSSEAQYGIAAAGRVNDDRKTRELYKQQREAQERQNNGNSENESAEANTEATAVVPSEPENESASTADETETLEEANETETTDEEIENLDETEDADAEESESLEEEDLTTEETEPEAEDALSEETEAEETEDVTDEALSEEDTDEAEDETDGDLFGEEELDETEDESDEDLFADESTDEDEELEDDWADEEDDWEDDEDDWEDEEEEEEKEFSYEVPANWDPTKLSGDDTESSDEETEADQTATKASPKPAAEQSEAQAAPQPTINLEGLTAREKLKALEALSQRRRDIAMKGTTPENLKEKIMEGLRKLDQLSALQSEKSITKAFIRVTPLTPDKAKKALVLPDFPISAPELDKAE